MPTGRGERGAAAVAMLLQRFFPGARAAETPCFFCAGDGTAQHQPGALAQGPPGPGDRRQRYASRCSGLSTPGRCGSAESPTAAGASQARRTSAAPRTLAGHGPAPDGGHVPGPERGRGQGGRHPGQLHRWRHHLQTAAAHGAQPSLFGRSRLAVSAAGAWCIWPALKAMPGCLRATEHAMRATAGGPSFERSAGTLRPMTAKLPTRRRGPVLAMNARTRQGAPDRAAGAFEDADRIPPVWAWLCPEAPGAASPARVGRPQPGGCGGRRECFACSLQSPHRHAAKAQKLPKRPYTFPETPF